MAAGQAAAASLAQRIDKLPMRALQVRKMGPAATFCQQISRLRRRTGPVAAFCQQTEEEALVRKNKAIHSAKQVLRAEPARLAL